MIILVDDLVAIVFNKSEYTELKHRYMCHTSFKDHETPRCTNNNTKIECEKMGLANTPRIVSVFYSGAATMMGFINLNGTLAAAINAVEIQDI